MITINQGYILDLFFYLFVVFLPTWLLYRICNHKEKSVRYQIVLSLACVIPVMVFAVRYEVGNDWSRYKAFFADTAFNKRHPALEIGNHWMAVGCKLLGLDFYAFELVYAAIMEFCVIKSMQNLRLKQELWIGFCVFSLTLFFTAFNITAQVVACSLVLLAYSYHKRHKAVLPWLLLLLAISFHLSAIIALGYPALKMLMRIYAKNKKLFCVCMMIPITAALLLLAGPGAKLAHSLGLYERYTIEKMDMGELSFLLYLIPELVLVFLFAGRMQSKEKYEVLTLFLLTLPIRLMGVLLHYAGRLMLYTTCFRTLLYPMILRDISHKKARLKFCVMTIGWFILHFFVMFYLLNDSGDLVFPYATVWEAAAS